MPRPIVVGNGRILLALDDRYRIRDLFYPQVGLYNHLSGNSIRMGVWASGLFSWIDEDGWTREFSYDPGTLTAKSRLTNASLELQFECEDAVLPGTDIYLRRIMATNLGQRSLDVRFFFTHDLNVMESDIGNTAYYNPFLRGVVHYKGFNWFLFGGRTNAGGVMQYATGIKGFGGLQGTWRDAEDGALSMNPIAQGSVDSTLSLHTKLEPGARSEVQYWLVCGKDLPEVTERFEVLKEKGVRSLIEDSGEHWRRWSDMSDESAAADGSPDDIAAFALQSLLILKTQIDSQGGILAANDSDIMETNRANYSYVWPRDGALVAEVLDNLGYHEETSRYFRFCSKLITPEQPFFLQKYRPDGAFGASWHSWIAHGKPEVPLQEDETALTLHALAIHIDEAVAQASRLRLQDDDVALASDARSLLTELYEPMVVPAADFLLAHRDPTTGLPLPSYDLWEERRGVHTYTVGTVVAGLRAAAKLALSFGDDRTMNYALAAEEILEAMRTHLAADGRLIRGLIEVSPGQYEPDLVTDSSLLQLVTLGVFDADDPLMAATAANIEQKLWINSAVRGLARYEGDYYFRRSDAYPGNPWIICTLWLAQYKLLTNQREKALELIRWVMSNAASTGVLPEQLHPDTGEHLSVSPLTWSHAEFVKTAHMLKTTS